MPALARVFSCFVSAHALLALLALRHTSKHASLSAIPTPEPHSSCISVSTTLLFLHFFLYYYYFIFFAVLHWHSCIPALLHYFSSSLRHYYTVGPQAHSTSNTEPVLLCCETRASCCPLYTIEKQAIFSTCLGLLLQSRAIPSPL
jgi:hypothetical protein